MKNVSLFKFLAAAFALLIFSACSKQHYSFAPGTGGYHGDIKKAPTTAQTSPAEENPVFTANQTDVSPEITATKPTEAAAALAQNFNAKKEATATSEIATKASKKETRQMFKEVKQQLKTLKKDSKNGKTSKGLGLDRNIKLLLILGLAFLLVGGLLSIQIIYVIGGILLVIALVLLLMEIL